ncbi:MAG: HDOD domain-containing protein [Gammaproteobacteria bacterium]|nr:HDOD domain-containing protein [Gammaproteobacteria bacterium]
MELALLIHEVRDLAPLPKAYFQIQQLINDANSDLDDLTKVIVNDPGLTSRILRISNSAYVGLSSKVDTIGRAIQILGLNQIHDLALADAAVGSLQKIQSKALNPYDFWRGSMYAAIVARVLAKRCKVQNAERLFVSGLFHQIGNLLLAVKDPPAYSALRDGAIRRQIPLAQAQREELGYDYAEASAELLTHWRLPETLMEPVRYHTREIPGNFALDTAIIHLAAAFSRAAMWKSDADEPVPAFDLRAMNLTNLDEAMVEELMTEADQQLIEAMSLLLPDLKKSKTLSRSAA